MVLLLLSHDRDLSEIPQVPGFAFRSSRFFFVIVTTNLELIDILALLNSKTLFYYILFYVVAISYDFWAVVQTHNYKQLDKSASNRWTKRV